MGSGSSPLGGEFLQRELTISTDGFSDVHNLTETIENFLGEIGGAGLVNVFVPGSTASITTMEYEEGCVQDLQEALEQVAPSDETYEHNKKWGDGNGFSHLRSSLLGPGLTAPYREGSLQNGTWQQVVLVDNDNRERDRDVLLTALRGKAKTQS